MKISNLSTLIITPNSEKIVSVFNELGFAQEHQKNFNAGDDITSTIMKNEDGHMISIANAPVERDMTVVRMNVDDFDEAYALLKSKGFVNAGGSDKAEDTGTSKAALMISPTGFAISLTQHIK